MLTLTRIKDTPHWLDQGAATSLSRMAAQGMPVVITEAYRDGETQAARYRTYLAGGNFALPPGQSMHERGLAVDFKAPSSAWLLTHGSEHGWRCTNQAEPWHWEYDPDRDQHRLTPTPAPTQKRRPPMTLWSHQGTVYVLHSLGLTHVADTTELAVLQTALGAPVDLDTTGYKALREVAIRLIKDSAANLKGQGV